MSIALLPDQGMIPAPAGHRIRHRQAWSGKMAKNSNSDDNALFRAAIGEVSPVSTRRLHLPPEPPRPRARFRRADEAAALQESLQSSPAQYDTEAGDELLHRRAGVSPQLIRKLRRGHYTIQAEMDLHGMTSAEAKIALREFIVECGLHDYRCVRIIHGKGLRSGERGPVLKTSVNRWLRHWDEVLAFCSATARDGGTGALYVLIRN